jgi:hypothetical protein
LLAGYFSPNYLCGIECIEINCNGMKTYRIALLHGFSQRKQVLREVLKTNRRKYVHIAFQNSMYAFAKDKGIFSNSIDQ